MSEDTTAADQSVHEAQEVIKGIAISDIKQALDHLASAVSSLITAVEAIDRSLDDLECASGEDPGIQISHLKDSLGDVERRIERLERQGD